MEIIFFVSNLMTYMFELLPLLTKLQLFTVRALLYTILIIRST